MKTFIVTKKATKEDIKNLEAAAKQFYEDYHLDKYGIDSSLDSVQVLIEILEDEAIKATADEKKLIEAWKECNKCIIGDEDLVLGFIGHDEC